MLSLFVPVLLPSSAVWVCLLPVLWPNSVICLAVHELGYIRVKFKVFMSTTIFNIPVGFYAGAGVPRSRSNGLFALQYGPLSCQNNMPQSGRIFLFAHFI